MADRDWFDENGYSGVGSAIVPGQRVPGMYGFVYNSAGGMEPVDGTPGGPGERTNGNGVSSPRILPPPSSTQALPGATPPPSATTAVAPASIANVGHNDRTSAGLNREEWRDKWLSSGVTDMAGLQRFIAENGGRVLSDNGTVETPFGETLDIGANARTGRLTPAWTQVGGGASGGSGGGDGAGGFSLGSLGSAGPQTAMNAPQANLTSGGFNYAQGVPQTERVNYTPFTMPTRDEALAADPGFQFGLDQGLGQLGAQASARGSIRDPNYRQGMTKFAIDYGNTHYADAANRLFQTHQANQGGAANAVNANNATALGAQGQGFGQALGGFNANLGALGQQQQYGLGLGNLALGNKQADNSYSLGQGNLSLGRDQFGLQQQGQYWNQAFNNNAQQWDQYYKLAQLGYPQS